MNFQLVPSNGNRISSNKRGTHQSSSRRGDTRGASGTWTWCPDPYPWQQQTHMYAAIPPQQTTNSPGFLSPAVANQAHWGHAVHRETCGGVCAARTGRRSRGRGAVADRQRSTGVGPGGIQDRSQSIWGSPAGGFLSDVLDSIERLGRECPEVFRPSNPVVGTKPGRWQQRLLAILNVEPNDKRESTTLQGDGAGMCVHCKTPSKELPPNTGQAEAASGRCDDKHTRSHGEGESISASPPSGVCSKSHPVGDPCSDKVQRY
nr:putative long-distance movement protein [Carrot umbravirus 2]